jgi:Cell wall-active antibiotics response 4TMS YvqF/Domain of unknown function (DUF1707)
MDEAMAYQPPPTEVRRPAVSSPALDASREDALALLRRHIRDGDLTLEEYGVRVEGILLAESSSEVVRAVDGLPVLSDPVTSAVIGDRAPAMQLPVPSAATNRALATRRSVSSYFGDTRLEGRWRAADEVAVKTLFGNARIDLRQASVMSERLVITGIVAFGALEIIVPPGTELEIEQQTIFGSRRQDEDEYELIPGMPIVRIEARVLFGDLVIRVRAIGERRFRLGRRKKPS